MLKAKYNWKFMESSQGVLKELVREFDTTKMKAVTEKAVTEGSDLYPHYWDSSKTLVIGYLHG